MAIKTTVFDSDAIPTGEDIRDALIGLPDVDRGVVITRPNVGQVPIVALNGDPVGVKVKLAVEFDDVPIA